jgi:regulator of RNase E activity RraA
VNAASLAALGVATVYEASSRTGLGDADQRIAPGDYVVMDADGAVAVAKDQVADVAEAASRRERPVEMMRKRLAAGELTLDLLGLR